MYDCVYASSNILSCDEVVACVYDCVYTSGNSLSICDILEWVHACMIMCILLATVCLSVIY